MPGLTRSGRADGTRGYSVSLLQAAAALYGADVARLLGEQSKSLKSNKKIRE